MPLQKTLRCFACSELFRDVHVEGAKIRHGHHVIPRAYGGSKGPIVDICNEDHDLLHSLADKVTSGKLELSLVQNSASSDGHAKKLTWLVSLVVAAADLTRNDPNKRGQVSLILKAEQIKKLDDLSKIFNKSSRASTLLYLIEQTHGTHFKMIQGYNK